MMRFLMVGLFLAEGTLNLTAEAKASLGPLKAKIEGMVELYAKFGGTANGRAVIGLFSGIALSGAVEVGAEISGRIEQVHFDYNDPVEAGAVLAKLDTDQLEARVLQGRANLAVAAAAEEQARATLEEARSRSARGKARQAARLALSAAPGEGSLPVFTSTATIARVGSTYIAPSPIVTLAPSSASIWSSTPKCSNDPASVITSAAPVHSRHATV